MVVILVRMLLTLALAGVIFFALWKLWRKLTLTTKSREEVEEALIKIDNQVKLAEEVKDFTTIKKLEKSRKQLQEILKKGAKINV